MLIKKRRYRSFHESQKKFDFKILPLQFPWNLFFQKKSTSFVKLKQFSLNTQLATKLTTLVIFFVEFSKKPAFYAVILSPFFETFQDLVNLSPFLSANSKRPCFQLLLKTTMPPWVLKIVDENNNFWILPRFWASWKNTRRKNLLLKNSILNQHVMLVNKNKLTSCQKNKDVKNLYWTRIDLFWLKKTNLPNTTKGTNFRLDEF